MFSLIKTVLMLPFIPIIAFNHIFNISIAENFPKTNIELPNYKFNDLYDSLITNIPDYYNSDHPTNSYTSILNSSNGFQHVSFDCSGFYRDNINITVNQNTLSMDGTINKCIDYNQFDKYTIYL